MKTKKIFSFIAIVLATGTLTLTSCKKNKETITDPVETDTDTEQTTATDNNLSENTDSDIESMGAEVSENMSLANYRPDGNNGVTFTEGVSAAPCATVTAAAKVFTVDFGTAGCVGADGRTRKGKLIYDFSGSASGANYYRNPGFKLVVTSQNYVVDGNQVNIVNKTITNTTPSTINPGKNPGTNLTWSISANINIVKASNSGTVTWTCNRTKELLNTADTNCYKGQSTHIRWNLAWVKLNGSASGTNASNENYTSTATNLERHFDCSPDALHPHRHPFIAGTLSFTPGARKTRVIDFGNGACDMLATLTINNKSYSFVMP